MNLITIELCTEDRARIDRLIEALERKSCDACVNGALSWSEQVSRAEHVASQQSNEPDPAPVEVAAPVAPPPPAPDPIPEPATDPDPIPEPATDPDPVPTLEEFQKALTLRCAESETTKAKVRALLHEYAPAASRVPEDKRAEVLARLAKL